jgi:HEAT repeat protein
MDLHRAFSAPERHRQWRRRFAWSTVGVVLAAGVTAQSQIVNAQLTSRQATRGLDAEIRSAAAPGGPVWIAYRVATVRGPRHMCNENNWKATRLMLEPATELTILIRVENGRIERLQPVTPDCEVDAGGLPVVWLDGISTAQSAAWLTGQLTTGDPLAQREPRMIGSALSALIWHPGEAPIATVVALARDDRRPQVRGQALFWLSQRAGQQAVGAIRNAVDNDPESEVKRKAVFALSQLPKDEGIPLLIEVARNNRNREVRRQAMFWLGQSNDPRAVAFFEQVLKP